MSKEKRTRVIGLMSGTSLDGLDICLVCFNDDSGHWNYEIEAAETISYPEEWVKKLLHAEKTSGAELMKLHREYGNYLGECVNGFLKKHSAEKPLFVASHGHTIFHRPVAGYTFQLGEGGAIRNACGIPVVSDFRTLDVSLGGQGAPLVPIGDALLFSQYDYCLNLGGIANISFEENGKRMAFDICAINYVLNRLAKRLGKNYDENGNSAASGKIIPELLEKLNALPYYKKSPPKSIGREGIEEIIFPLLSDHFKTEDLLRTFSEHVAEQISAVISRNGKLLITGGGAHNPFFIGELRKKCKAEIVIPDSNTIDFKEALIFAFLGLLRWNNRINTLASVTGASRDSSGGTIFS